MSTGRCGVCCGVALGLRQSGFRNGGLPRRGRAQNLFFFGGLAFGYNSSSMVSAPSSDGTAPSNKGERAGVLFGDGRVAP